VSSKAGFFEVADKGTLFLDEIGDLSFELQGKLLRVIQERKYIPVGGTEPKETNIRLIAATNKNLKKMVLTGAFREDLFYRLYVVPIFMPPLRERQEDIRPLAEYFLKRLKDKYEKPDLLLSEDAMNCLLAYQWPGNIRELENTVERVVLSMEGMEILPANLPDFIREAGQGQDGREPTSIEELKKVTKELRQKAVEEVERRFVINALAANEWKVSAAAQAVGMQRTNFYRLIKKYDVNLPGKNGEADQDMVSEAD
jgi:transcriptional regulator with PAS, ATPase and Fis domain